MMAVRNGCSRSCEVGGCFTRKLAITPSSTTVVVPVSRTVGQNRAVSNDSTRAIEPPLNSTDYTHPVPATCKSGRFTMQRPSAPRKWNDTAPAVYRWAYVDITPFDGPVVPEV